MLYVPTLTRYLPNYQKGHVHILKSQTLCGRDLKIKAQEKKNHIPEQGASGPLPYFSSSLVSSHTRKGLSLCKEPHIG